MVHGANKSGGRRKVFVRTPTGTRERYKESRPGKARCACGKPLAGTARGTRTEINKLSKTQKRPSRPFGGQLCAACSKQLLRETARLSSE